MDVFETIRENKIIPVIKINDSKKAINVANALLDGGINICEITFRTDEALASIKIISEACPNMIVGAGTIINTYQAKQAIQAGAKFIVSPGISEELCTYCLTNNTPIIPGCVTSSEIMLALKLGINTIKFFPCDAFGGIKAIKALSAPFPTISFLPTGGINYDNLVTYLSHPKVCACGASYLASEKLIDNNEYEEISKLAALSKEKISKLFSC